MATTAALSLVLLLVASAPASSLSVYTWDAHVGAIADGDTFYADIPGVGSDVKIRMTGVQAMEIGDCNAAEATERLRELLGDRDAVLSAHDPSVSNRGRPMRWVTVDGRDAGLTLISEGLALAAPHSTETSKTAAYLTAAQRARHNRTGPLWDDDRCGSGPDQDNPIRIWVQWDADGDDGKNLNGEYVRIWNRGSDPLELGGWSVRDGGLTIYRFPNGVAVPARGFLTLHVGSGTNTATKRYWRSSVPIFANNGDLAALVDPDNDVRAIMDYPCKVYCDTGLRGKVRLRVNAKGSTPNEQYVVIRNVSDRKIDLAGYQLVNWPYSYDFVRSGLRTHMYPGWELKLRIGKGSETWMRRYWGKGTRILDTRSDRVELMSFDAVRQACVAWGSRTC